MPVIILTRDNASEVERNQQIDLQHLSRNARQETAAGSGHFIHIERPDLVIASINEVLAPGSTQESRDGVKDGGASFQKFVGTWESKCQDGATFVVVDLQLDAAQLEGTVSIGNMQGDNTGACLMVLAPPSPEHSQKISSASAKQDILSFNGAKRPDGTFARFELKEMGEGKGELKLLDTPVADHPWQLVKPRKPKDH
jgi:hypothetical protein